MWACLYFSAIFPFLGSFGDVIFDELWVVTDIDIRVNDVIFDELWVVMDIDIRVNTVHGPVFDDAEVKSASLLT